MKEFDPEKDLATLIKGMPDTKATPELMPFTIPNLSQLFTSSTILPYPLLAPEHQKVLKEQAAFLNKISQYEIDENHPFADHFKLQAQLAQRHLKIAEDLKSAERKRVLDEVGRDGRYLARASDEFRNDREIVLAAVQGHGEALAYASENLRNDRDVVLAAVRQDGEAYQYASKALKSDCHAMYKKVIFRGSSAHHQNVDAERSIKTIVHW